MSVLKTTFNVIYKTTNITKDIAADLLSLSYDDKADSEADEIAISLKDETGKWSGPWFPTRGDLVKASLYSEGFGKLYCGAFYVDSVTTKGVPRIFEIKGVSIPFNTTIRRRRRNRAWEKTNLKAIATQVAAWGKLKLLWDSETNPTYDRVEQKRESDLAFLARMCKEAELSLKISDNQVVIFDQAAYDKKPAIKTITIGGAGQLAKPGDVISYSFECQLSDTYGECTVEYKDPKTGKFVSKTFYDDSVEEGSQSCKLVKRATSLAEAERMAKAELRRRNMREITGSLTVVGDVSLVAGANINITGAGGFDGKFAVESATHKIAPYTTQLKVRKVRRF